MFYYVYYVSEFPKIENAYRKRVVLFLRTDTHSATERQMVKMCVCVCAFAGWQCWPGWLCFWVGVLSAWRRPQWWWVFKQRPARKKNNSSPQADIQHRIPPSVCEWVCVSSLCRGICVQPKLCECDFKFSKVTPAKMQSLIVCLWKRKRGIECVCACFIMKTVFHSGNSAVMAQSQKGRKIGQRLKLQCVWI